MTSKIEELVQTDFEAMKGVEGTFGQHVYATREDLPEKLRAYYQDTGGPFAWLHHPLYVTLMPTISPIPLDELLAKREERAQQFLDDGEVGSYVFAHERGYRMGKLLDLDWDGYFDDWGGLPRRSVRFWKVAASVWVDAEFDESDPCWTRLMKTSVPCRAAMTESKDRRALRAMPEAVTVYRGVQSADHGGALHLAHSGWSWTFSQKTARFFARRWLKLEDTPFVIRAEIPKDLIQAYLTGRGEAEVLIEPGAVEGHSIRVQRVSRKHEPRSKPSGPEEDWTDG